MLGKPRLLFAAAAAAVLGAALFYAFAFVASDLLALQSSADLCRKGRFLLFEEHLVPLSAKCVYRDGTSEQLVSPLVNPILALLVLAALLLFVLGLRAIAVRTIGPSARSARSGRDFPLRRPR